MPVHLLDLNDGHPNRGTAAIVALVEGAGQRAATHDVRRAGALPPPGPAPWILGGGPGSPLQAGPWRGPLLAALGSRLAANLPTLGICFGMEMLALALGATARPLGQPREGLHPVQLLREQHDDPLLHDLHGELAYEQRHWGMHGGRGTVVAMGPERDVAAFRHGRSWGVIFHPEADFGEPTRAVFSAVIPRFLSLSG